MIKTSMQLKALVRNRSNGDSVKAQIIIRNYIMERFLERVSISQYRNNIIIKGGMLIASIVGNEKRSTMDIDSTLINIQLTEENVISMVQEITNIKMDDNVVFTITDISTIMEDFDYPGVRVVLYAEIDRMRTPLKLDFSTDDIIIPKEIEYSYQLMFEDRSIIILAYNIATILAEKFETVISRGITNTRMRDFYDIYTLLSLNVSVNRKHFVSALMKTSLRRGSNLLISDWKKLIGEIQEDKEIQDLWLAYQKKFDYAINISWNEVISSVINLGSLIE